MFAAGATTWIYTRFQNTSGGNTSRSLTASALAGALLFVLFFTVMTILGIG